MPNRFRFHRQDVESSVVEGERVNKMGNKLTVMDEHGHSLASFLESDLVAWWQLQDGLSGSPKNGD